MTTYCYASLNVTKDHMVRKHHKGRSSRVVQTHVKPFLLWTLNTATLGIWLFIRHMLYRSYFSFTSTSSCRTSCYQGWSLCLQHTRAVTWANRSHRPRQEWPNRKIQSSLQTFPNGCVSRGPSSVPWLHRQQTFPTLAASSAALISSACAK